MLLIINKIKENKMTLVKWNPINSMSDVFDSFDGMFNYGINRFGNRGAVDSQLNPSVNVKENKDEFFVLIDLPGVDKKDLQLNLSEGCMTVIAERKDHSESKNEDHVWQESRVGRYERSFELPVNINEDKIKAKFKNGVLSLIIPKEDIVSKVKKIAIN